jgi:hypothetical protein
LSTRRLAWAAVAVTGLALGGCPKAAAPAWSVTLDDASGASWCAPGGDSCAPASAGEHAAAGAFLRTSDEGFATAKLDDETTADIGSSAAITLADGNPRVLAIRSGIVVVHRTPTGQDGHAPIVVRAGTQLAKLDGPNPTVVRVRARDDGDRASLSVDHGLVTLETGPEGAQLHAGDTATLAKGKEVDRRGVYSGTVARVATPFREDTTHSPPRGLGTMTARNPGMEEVVAGVRLASHHVRAVVQNGFARTEVEEEFANDTDRVLEGRYVFAVPPRAVTARLALWVGDKLVEDEVVERKRAAAIFKDVVDDTVRPRDPALLEWVASGELSLKVFPIPAKGTRTVVLDYDEALVTAGDEVRYVYPLSLGEARANTIDDLSISVTASDPDGEPLDVDTPRYAATIAHGARSVTATFAAKGYSPVADFVLAWRVPKPSAADAAAFVPSWGGPPDLGLDRTAKAAGTDSFGAMRLAIGLPEGASPPPFRKRDRVIAIDTSQSQARETLDAEVRLALAIARSLEPDERVALLACDSACSSYPEKGLAPSMSESFAAAEQWAKTLAPAGSSDVAGAIVSAASRLDDGAGAQIVYIGDGAATSGELSPLHVAQRAKPIVDRKAADVRFIGAGVTVDAAQLSILARALGATYQPLATGEPLRQRIDDLTASLRMPVVRSPTLKLPDTVTDAYPRTLPNLVLGDQVLLVAKLASTSDTTVELSGEVDGAPWSNTYAVVWGTSPERQATVVPRLWAAQRVEELIAEHDPTADKESIDLSKRFHILSRLTSMLVLENDAMFAGYGVKRTVAPDGSMGNQTGTSSGQQINLGLLQALSGGPGAASAMNGNAGMASVDGPPVDLNTTANRGSGIGNVAGGPSLNPGGGTVRPGSGGLGGIGSPSGAGGMITTTSVAVGTVVVGGVSMSVPVANAQAVVRSQLSPAARRCYQKGLEQDPTQAGRLTLMVRVAPDGEVDSASVAQNTGLSAGVGNCVGSAARRMKFEAPGSASVLQVPVSFVSQPGPRLEPSQVPPQQVFPGMMGSPPPPPPPPRATTRKIDDAWRTAGDDAIQKLRATSDASPLSRMKREALVRGMLARGRFDEALPLARAFVEADPDLPVARELLSYAAVATGDTKAALLAVDAGVETSPASAKAHVRAARAFESAHDETRACAHWRSLAELDGAQEWKYEALRCRARALGDREAALAEASAVDKPGKLIEALKPLLASGQVPAYDPSSHAIGQIEVSVTCAPGVEDCPLPIVVAPNGTVFSPFTPADARSSAHAVAITNVRDGPYRTMLVGGATGATGDVAVRAADSSLEVPFTRGGLQSLAESDVTVPPPWLYSLIGISRAAW